MLMNDTAVQYTSDEAKVTRLPDKSTAVALRQHTVDNFTNQPEPAAPSLRLARIGMGNLTF
jgi:hypothetical protein